MLYCLHKGIDVPGQHRSCGLQRRGIAGRFAAQTGHDGRLPSWKSAAVAAEIIAGKRPNGMVGGEVIELFPTLQPGDTIRKLNVTNC